MVRPKKPRDYTAKELASHLLRVRAAQTSFLDFVHLHQPNWTLPDFQLRLIDALNRLENDTLTNPDGEQVDNLLVTMPPRFAKSSISTVLFPAYFMARDPERFLMSCSYNAQLATDFGRQVRALAESDELSQAFPDFRMSKDSRAADVWRTENNGAYFAVGIGGTTSGRPANLLILDDPIKSRDDAESITQRNKTWNYYTSALATRLQPQNTGSRAKQIIVLTRWHPDDVAGRLQRSADWKEGRWHHVDFKAIIEVRPQVQRDQLPPDHPLFMAHGPLQCLKLADRLAPDPSQPATEASLWPERFPIDELQRRRRLNPREFASLYQQTPYILGGNLLRTEWWRYYPVDLRPERFTSLVIAVDTAYKRTESNDYSVALVAGIDSGGDIYIVDIMRARFEFPELKQRLIHLNAHWRGKGLRATYIEDKASGMSLIQELKRHSGISVIPYKAIHDKVARVHSILPLIEGGRVFLPEEAPWLDDFIAEATAFPGGTHDDQVDAFHIAVDVLSKTSISPEDLAMSIDLGLSLNQQIKDQANLATSSLGGEIVQQTLRSLNRQTSSKNSYKPWKGWGQL